MRPSSLLLAVLAICAVALSGCSSKIPGEVDAPPPPGGPKASDRHPPGVTDEEAAKANLK
ncbi:MAG: hypothetical protein N2109_03615 [Fimbriimonadales bacterium]|nr:hypothetical protein [Fimbriimonadales bacterium]